MRDKQITKIFKAVEMIARTSGATNRDLRDHLGVDRRSIYRTLDTLQALGFPLYGSQCKKSHRPKPTPLASPQSIVFTDHKPLVTDHCRGQKGLFIPGSGQ